MAPEGIWGTTSSGPRRTAGRVTWDMSKGTLFFLIAHTSGSVNSPVREGETHRMEQKNG